MKNTSLRIAFLLLVTTSTLTAQDFKPVTDEAAVLASLKKNSENTTSIQADFREERFASYLKEPQKSSGVFYYKKADRMRWEQNVPFSYIIMVNGDRLRVKEEGKEKKLGQAAKMAGRIRDMLLTLVSGDFQNSKAFARECKQDADHFVIILTPVDKKLKNVYSKIHLRFSKKNLVLRELTFFEKSGDRNVMKFSNEKINTALSDDLFLKL